MTCSSTRRASATAATAKAVRSLASVRHVLCTGLRPAREMLTLRAREGRHSFDLSAPITAGPSCSPSLHSQLRSRPLSPWPLDRHIHMRPRFEPGCAFRSLSASRPGLAIPSPRSLRALVRRAPLPALPLSLALCTSRPDKFPERAAARRGTTRPRASAAGTASSTLRPSPRARRSGCSLSGGPHRHREGEGGTGRASRCSTWITTTGTVRSWLSDPRTRGVHLV